MDRIFTSADTWNGGFYELAMQYGPRAAMLLDAGLRAVWQHPSLQGAYLRSDVEPSQQQPVDPSLETQLEAGHLRGIATLPNGRRIACGTFTVLEEGGNDWLGFYLPLGALQSAYDVGAYPFDEPRPSRKWREPLENWLAEIGQSVFAGAPFRLALIGFEVSGTDSAEELANTGIRTERGIGYLIPSAQKLGWYPTNQWQTQPRPVS